MFKLIAKQEKEFTIFKFNSFLFLISVFLFGTSCQSIKKKAVQSLGTSVSRSLAGLPKSSAGISGTQINQFNQLKRRERQILSRFEKDSLKVAYSFLVNEKTKRICYVESFKTRDIIPPFAKPASYKEARFFKKPPFSKCSSQEYSTISSYQNASILTDDLTGGVQVAGLPLAVGATGFVVCVLGADKTIDFVNSYMDKNSLGNLSTNVGAMGTGYLMSMGAGGQMIARAIAMTTASAASVVFPAILGCGIGIMGTYVYHSIIPEKDIIGTDISVP